MNLVVMYGTVANEPRHFGTATQLVLKTNTGQNQAEGKEFTAITPVTIFGLNEDQKTKLKEGVTVLLKGVVKQTSYQKEGSQERTYTTKVHANAKDTNITT